MKKRFLSVLLCICMMLSLFSTAALAATWDDVHIHYLCGGSTCSGSGHEAESSKTTFEKEIKQVGGTLYIDNIEWTVSSSDNYALDGGVYYLSTDLTLDAGIKITGNVTLCLNGHSITSAVDDNVITVNSGVTFTLTDCNGGSSNAAFGKITHASDKDGRGVYISTRSTFNMYGGSIAGNNMVTDDYVGNDEVGGGVYITGDGATFNMYGGIISGNTAGSSGGGVYMGEKTNFNMYGGAVCGNTATRNFGGGVCVYINGNFNMSGGEIGDNGARAGGGVFVGDNSTFAMTGGSITGNNVSGWRAGGGIYISDSAKKITVSGNIQITGNMKTGTKNENGKYTGGITENLYLNDGMTITIGTDGLTTGASIGVTLAGDYGDNVFTSGWNANMSGKTLSDYFISDVDGKNFTLSGGEVKLSDSHTHYLCGGSTCNGSGHETESNKTAFAKEIKQEGDKLYIDGAEWTATGFYALDAGNYYLSTDLTLKEYIKIQGNVTLCLNGHSITRAVDGAVIIVYSNLTFTLTDCKGGNPDAAFGKITHASDEIIGRGVKMNHSSTFNMYGGSIAGNTVTGDASETANAGGGVHIDDGAAFKMYGGTISGNTAGNSGGGVYVGNNGSFTITDSASITNNEATENGGGVYTEKNSTFYMYGGNIIGNNAGNNGGGVYKGGDFYVCGGAQIRDNVKSGTKDTTGKYTGGTANNVYLPVYNVISIGTTLTDGAKIGVTLDSNFGESAFTSGWSSNMMSGQSPSDYFTSDVDGKALTLFGGEVRLVSTYVHSWTYTANGDTITATCKNCEDNNGQDYVGGTCTVTASDATYNGKTKTATVSGTGIFENVDMSISYSKYNATSEQFESTNILPAGAGKYMASITYGGATAGVEYTIGKATREAPEGLTASPAGSIGGKGKINGTTSGTYTEVKAMEYNTSATATTGWKDCSDGSTEVAPGTYYVRYKESYNYLASAVSAALTVDSHTHSGGTATCQKKAVCDGCGQEYGELVAHNYTESATEENLKSAANCNSKAVYYKSCLACGEKSNETFEYGEFNYTNHEHTEIRNARPATEQENGYTGDIWCLDCKKEITQGENIDKLIHKPEMVEAKRATVTEQGNIEYYHCDNCGKNYADANGTKEISVEETVIKKLPPEIIEGNNSVARKGAKESLTFRSNAAYDDFIRIEIDGKTLDEKNYTIVEGSIVVVLNDDFVSTLPVGEHTLGIVSESGTATAKFTVNTGAGPIEVIKTGDNNCFVVCAFLAFFAFVALGGVAVIPKKKRIR